MPPRRLERLIERADYVLAGGLVGPRGLFGEGAAGEVRQPAVAAARPRAGAWPSSGMPPALIEVGGHVPAAGLDVGDHRRRALMRSKSSMSSGTSASRAMASRCRTALVEPPVAATRAMAFSKASAGEDVARADVVAHEHLDHELADRVGDLVLARVHGGHASRCPSGERPMISIAMAIVLAVNWPPQAPAPGQARSSSSSRFRVADLAAPRARRPLRRRRER